MRKLLLTLSIAISLFQITVAQDNVGIGTLNPNPNALVDMTSNDKGLLVPRMTTVQRNAIPTAGITDKAMLVFDIDLDLFYYWDGFQWIGFPLDNDVTNELQMFTYSNDTLYLSDGNSVYISPNTVDTDDQTLSLSNDTLFIADGNFVVLTDNVNDADFDATNELQDLSFDADSIYLSNGNAISLTGINNQQITLSNDTIFVDNGGFVVLPPATIDTDDQTLSLSNDTLFIADGNFVVLTDNVNDADSDATNELQFLNFDADSIYLSNGNAIALSNIQDGTGTDDQLLTLSNDTIYLEDGGFVVLPSATVDTDDQTLAFSNDTLFIADGNFVVLSDNVNDADSDATNELQFLNFDADSIYLSNGNAIALSNIQDGTGTDDQLLTLSNDTIYLEDGGFVVLPSGTLDTDDQTLAFSNDTLFIAGGNFVVLTDNVNDADFDPTNELQDLGINGDSLTINSGTSISINDISNTELIGDTFLIVNGDTVNMTGVGTDNQNLTGATLIGTNLQIDIENGNSVNVDLGSLAAGLDSIYGQGDSLIFISNGGADTAFINLGGFADTDDQTLSLSNDTLFIADGNFVVLTDNVNDADFDPTNELQDLGINGDSLTINGGSNISINDLSSSTVLNDSTIVVNGDTLIINGTGGIDTDDQTLTLSNDTLFIADGNFVVLTDNVNDADFDPTNELQDLGINGDSLTINSGTSISINDISNTELIGDTFLIVNGDTVNMTGVGTDNQNLTGATLIGTNLQIDIENGNSVNVDLGSLAAGLDSIYGQGDSLIFISNGGADTAFINLGGFADTDDQTLSLSNDTLFIADGNFVVLTDNVNDADFDPTNELQDLGINGDSLTINGGSNISINDLSSSTVLNDSTIVVNGDTLIINGTGGIDTDDQTLALSNDTLFIADGNFVVLTDNVNDGDFDATNELQDLGINGDSLTINGGTSISINDISNTELIGDTFLIVNGDTVNMTGVGTDNQNLTGATLIGTNLQIDIENGNSVNVDLGSLAAGLDSIYGQGDSLLFISNGGADTAYIDLGGFADTDDQTLTLSNDTLFIADGNFVVLSDDVNDADFDPTNELQDLGINGDSLTINGGSNISINDLSSSTVLNDSTIVVNGDTLIINGTGGIDTDDQTLTLSNDTLFIADGNFVVLTDNVNDGDFDATNELQDLGINGDSLTINGGTSISINDISNTELIGDTFLIVNGDTVNMTGVGTDNQNLTGATLIGTNLQIDIENGNSVNVDLGSLAAGLDSIYGQGDSLLFISNGGVDTAYIDLGGFADTDDQTLTLSNDTLFIADGNFVVLSDDVNDADFDPTNELQDLGINGDSLTINGGSNISINDLSSSTVLNDSTIVVNGDTLIINGTGGIDTDDQTIDQLTLDGDTMLQISLEDDGVAPIELDLSPLLSDHNTLDDAYDEGGAGLGRQINALDGAVRINGRDGFIVTGNSYVGDTIEVTGLGVRMFFNPNKVAFRAGLVTGNQWNNINLGQFSFASGQNTVASGHGATAMGFNSNASANYSTVFGYSSTASGNISTAMGNISTASGNVSTAMGNNTSASGNYSTAMGNNTISKSYVQTTLGQFQDTVLTASRTFFSPTDRLFVIGNGTSNFSRNNALTMLKNGNTGFGNNASSPSNLLHLNNGAIDPLRIENLDTDATLDNVMVTDANGVVHIRDASTLGTINTDDQNLTISNDTIYLEDGGFVVLPSGTVDTDDQTLSIIGDQLTIADGNTITLPNDSVNDADSDSTNELQALSFDTDSIYLSNGNAIALSGIQDGTGTDDQLLTLSNDTIFLEDGGFVVLPAGTIDTDDQFVDQLILDGDTMLQISLDGDAVAPVELDLSSLGDDWKLQGNAGTNATDNFIGTTDMAELSIRTNNTEFVRITNKGQIETYNTGNSIYIGEEAGEDDDFTNNINIGIGRRALMANDTGLYNIAIGHNSLQNNTSSMNTAVGYGSQSSNTSGRGNSSLGFNSLLNNTTGYDNTGVGFHSLRNNTTGFGNTAFGRQSLTLNITGVRNSAFGLLSLGNNRASDNSSFGYTTLRGNVNGEGNVAFGNYAGVISGGDHNTYLGYRAGDSDSTAMQNTYVGAFAGAGLWTGTFQTGAEQKSGNVFLGYRSGYNENGSNKLYIENSDDASPLIYGEFDNDLVKVNGDLGVGSVVGAPSNTLHVNSGAIDPVRIENLATDATLDNVMVTDANGVVHIRDASTIGSSGDITSVIAGVGITGGGTAGALTMTANANNGLNVDAGADAIQLGGPLVENTLITQGIYSLDINLNSVGDFTVQDAGTDVFQIGDNGIMLVGDDTYFKDVNTAGTNLVSIIDDGNDGRLRVYENGVTSVDLDANTQFVFNEQGLDRNLRVESDLNANMLIVDAGSNRVGIGTVPAEDFHVNGDAYINSTLAIGTINAGNHTATISSTTPALKIGYSTAYNQVESGRLIFEENVSGQPNIGTYCGFEFRLDGSQDRLHLSSGCTAAAERMTFLRTGNIGIATVNPTANLSVNGTANKTGGGTWAVFSDKRLKKDISNYKEGLDFISKVRTVNFTYNEKMDEIWGENPSTKDRTYQGVIAQELQKIAPDMVREVRIESEKNPDNLDYDSSLIQDSETFLEVDPNKFTYALINSVQELSEQNKTLKEENELIKERLKDLETLMNKLIKSNKK